MRLLRFVCRHPVALLGVFTFAFVVWVWRDSFAPDPPQPEVGKGRPDDLARGELMTPFGADAGGGGFKGVAPEKSKLTPQDTAQVLTKLKPGMTRAEVEGLVGVPAAENIHPATVADGKVTYRTAYEADFGPAPTVRPYQGPRPLPVRRNPNAKGHPLVTLEFDATKPGHPLLGVHYPEPLS